MKEQTPQQKQIVAMFLIPEFTESFYELFDNVMNKKILEAAKCGDGVSAVNYANGTEYLRTFVNSITNQMVKENKAIEKDNDKSKKE